MGSIPGSERSPGKGNGNPLQYSCLGNPIDRGAWQATVHGVAKSHTGLSNQHFHFYQNTHDIFHRSRTNNTKLSLEPQKSPNSQIYLEKKEQI